MLLTILRFQKSPFFAKKGKYVDNTTTFYNT